MRTGKGMRLGLVVGVSFALLSYHSSPAAGATAPPLGQAAGFAALGASVDNTGITIVGGDVGVSPGLSVSGFPPGLVVGTIHTNDATAAAAQADAALAYTDAGNQACNVTLGTPDLGGLTLTPGVYCAGTLALSTTVTLDAQGDPGAVFILKAVSTLISSTGSSVILANGADPCNVFWHVGSAATLGTGSTFVGTILALTSITLQTGVTLGGRALALNAALTMDTDALTLPFCSVPPTAPSLGKAFSPASVNAGDVSTLTITLSNSSATVATLTAPLTDNLPGGVVIAATPNVGTTCGGVGAPTATAGGATVTLPTGRSIPAGGSCTLAVDVTAAGGTYINSLPAGALITSNGSNAAPAIATLTVVAPPGTTSPALGKAFGPASVDAGEVSTLTITLSNPDASVATLTAPLIDTLPSGMAIAATPNVGTTCGGVGAPTATAGGATVTLPTGRSIPAGGSCTLTVDVIAAGGSFINTLLAGALRTDHGSNTGPAIATLTVVPAPAVAAIPTMSEWLMIGLAALMVLMGVAGMRRPVV